MASIRNFGLRGVGQDIILGRRGGQIAWNGESNSFDLYTDREQGTRAQLNVNATPASATNAASKQYVDSVASGLDVKKSVRVATTANITLNDVQVVDGVTLVANDRVLVKDQTDNTQNGIYKVVDGGAWTRTEDADNDTPTTEVSVGMFTFVEEGATNSDAGFVLTGDGFVTAGPVADLDTDGLVFSQFSGAGSIEAGNGLVKSGNVLEVQVDGTTIEISNDTLQVSDTYVGNANITTVGTITTGTWNGTLIDGEYGGTGLDANNLTDGDLLVANGTTGYTALNLGSADTVLKVNGDGDGLEYGKVDLAAEVSGTLPIANGGTGLTSAGTAGNVLVSDGTDLVSRALLLNEVGDVTITSVATNDLLQYNGSGWVNVDPSVVGGNTFSTINGDSGQIVADNTSDVLDVLGGDSGGITVTAAENANETLTIEYDIDGLTGAANTLVLADSIAVRDVDQSATESATFTKIVNDLDIPHSITADGLVVRTAGDSYTSREVVASGVAGREGIAVVNGDGISGNITVGVDFTTLVTQTTVTDSTELFANDGVNNTKITVAELLADVSANNITADDSSVTVTDDGNTAGTITMQVDGGDTEMTISDGSIDMDGDVTVTTGNTFTVTDGATTLGGALEVTGVATFSDGTEALPGIAFTADTDTGIFREQTGGTICIVDEAPTIACFSDANPDNTLTAASGGEKMVFSHSDDAVRLNAQDDSTGTSTESDVNLRLVPQGTGQVFLGDPGTAASITTNGGTDASPNGEDLTISAGDSDDGSGDGGSINIGPGAGQTNDGKVCIQTAPTFGGADSTRTDIACFEGTQGDDNSFLFSSGAAGNGPTIAATGETNADIVLSPAGTGAITVADPSGYATNNASNDDALTTVKMVDDKIDAALVGSTVQEFIAVDFSDDGVQTDTVTIPSGARLVNVRVDVTVISDNTATTLEVGTSGTPGLYQATTDNDPRLLGSYLSPVSAVALGGATTVQANVSANGAATGSAIVVVEYVKQS